MDVLRDNISKYCNYDDIDNKNSDDVAAKAKVIRKYKWLVVYHNQLCYMHKKEDCWKPLQVDWGEIAPMQIRFEYELRFLCFKR